MIIAYNLHHDLNNGWLCKMCHFTFYMTHIDINPVVDMFDQRIEICLERIHKVSLYSLKNCETNCMYRLERSINVH